MKTLAVHMGALEIRVIQKKPEAFYTRIVDVLGACDLEHVYLVDSANCGCTVAMLNNAALGSQTANRLTACSGADLYYMPTAKLWLSQKQGVPLKEYSVGEFYDLGEDVTFIIADQGRGHIPPPYVPAVHMPGDFIQDPLERAHFMVHRLRQELGVKIW